MIRAGKRNDDALWARFKAAGDVLYAAKAESDAVENEEYQHNLEQKLALLTEAEPLLKATDRSAARAALLSSQTRWDAIGKVPRDQIKPLEAGIRRVEQEIRGLEDDQWRKSDPEKSARADDMVTKLRDAITKLEGDLEKARAAGNDKRVRDLEADLAARKAFLEMAEKTAAEFS